MRFLSSVVAALLVLFATTFMLPAPSRAAGIECPKEMDPEDSGWSLVLLLEAELEKERPPWGAPRPFHTVRTFLYQPDPARRVGGDFLPDCMGMVHSFLVGNYETIIWKRFLTPRGVINFLKAEDGGWMRGSDIVQDWYRNDPVFSHVNLTLYEGQTEVLGRKIPIR